MKPGVFYRKTFAVEAWRVSEDNMAQVAEWCGGKILTGKLKGQDKLYIQVPVAKSLSARQTKAFAGDWVLFLDAGGFKVYLDESFANTFDSKPPGGGEGQGAGEVSVIIPEHDCCCIWHNPNLIPSNLAKLPPQAKKILNNRRL